MFMLHPNIDQTVDQLCFPARFLRDFEAAKRGQLHIDVANPSRSAANPAQQFQQLSLVPIPHRKQQVQQRLETAAGGPKVVNGLTARVRREPHQIPFHLAKNKFAVMRYQSHRN